MTKPKDNYSNGSKDFWPMVAAAEALLAGVKIEHIREGQLYYSDSWLVLEDFLVQGPLGGDYTFDFKDEPVTRRQFDNYQNRYSFRDRNYLKSICSDFDWPNKP